MYSPLLNISSARMPAMAQVSSGHGPIPVSSIRMPMIIAMIKIMPGFLTFVKNSMNGIPPIIGTSTDRSGRKMGIMPSIATANRITK